MERKVAKFFSSSHISYNDILYILHEDRKTSIYLHGGSVAETYLPMKHIVGVLPQDYFLAISKGTVVARSAIYEINGYSYTMIDGRVLEGRHRGKGEHKRNRSALLDPSHNHVLGENALERFSAFDRLPLPACVVEVVYNSSGRSVDFIYRYCNSALAAAFGLEIEEIVDRLNSEFNQGLSRQWTLAYSDCAINGTPKILKLHNKNYGGEVTVYFYCPAPGYCASMIVSNKLLEALNIQSSTASSEQVKPE